MTRVLAIVGMHRSGTSLLARYLYESGLFIGTDLLGKHESNPAGHFEDWEFLNLHIAILAAHNLNHKVSSPVQWNINQAMLSQARALIDARSCREQWGWKDPRTCLILPFWKSLLPDCNFVVTYRHYLPVIRSLISRDMQIYRDTTNRVQRLRQRRFRQDEIDRLCNEYLRIWIWYNSEIIRNILEDPGARFSFISFEQLIHGETQHLDFALQQSGFVLRPPQHFKTDISRSKVTRTIALHPDVDLLREADRIHSRFSELIQKDRSVTPP